MVFTTSRYLLVNGWASITLSFLSLLLILAITLYPYHFSFEGAPISLSYNFLILGWARYRDLDVLVNILLFMPLGFSLTSYLARKAKSKARPALVVIFFVSLALSYTLEVLQAFTPQRFPSLVDVLSNTTGGLVGFLCFRIWATRNIQLYFFGYVTLAFLFSILSQRSTSLGNWDTTFPLNLGNEPTGDRPWQGFVSKVFIADRAMSEFEVEQAFSKKSSFSSMGDTLLASYQFHSKASYRDKTGHLPDLVSRGNPRRAQQAEGVFLGPEHWLETAGPASYLIQRIIKTSQFTIGIMLATDNLNQTGPARIISLSKDPGPRNFTLGQEGSDLFIRLRTSFAGELGVELIVPDVFLNRDPQNLVVSYNGSVLRVYVDGVRNSYSFEFSPGYAIAKHFFGLKPLDIRCPKILYYAIIFVPIGILLFLTTRTIRVPLPRHVIMVVAGMVASLMLEGILVSVIGRTVIMENLLLSIIFTTATIVFLDFVRYWSTLKEPHEFRV